jgi:hypothetical protein
MDLDHAARKSAAEALSGAQAGARRRRHLETPGRAGFLLGA